MSSLDGLERLDAAPPDGNNICHRYVEHMTEEGTAAAIVDTLRTLLPRGAKPVAYWDIVTDGLREIGLTYK